MSSTELKYKTLATTVGWAEWDRLINEKLNSGWEIKGTVSIIPVDNNGTLKTIAFIRAEGVETLEK